MSYFVVVPGALVPAALAPAVAAQLRASALAARLQRGRSATLRPADGAGAPHLAWLWSRFGGSGTPVTAPYAWRALAPATELPGARALWHADPVHFAFARDHLLVTALSDAPPTREESETLLAEAAAAAVECGAALHALDASHWFMSFDPPWSLAAVPLAGALGRSVQDLLPTGDDAPRWRRLLNEIQMRWHALPLNERREAEGRPTINGLWLHGGGTWQPLASRPFAALATADPVLRGWALASGVAPAALAGEDEMPAPAGDVLALCPQLAAAYGAWDWETWRVEFERLSDALEARCERAFVRGFDRVTLVLAGRETLCIVELGASDRLRFWRRGPLAELLAEQE
jgi:hypothetical protein